jgi:hypothetical protein
MTSKIGKLIILSWNFIFNHEVSPVRHIPDVAIRHYILQSLGLMWAVAFSAAIGSYTIFAVSVVGHVVLSAAAAITVLVLTAAANKPQIFTGGLGRGSGGEHD